MARILDTEYVIDGFEVLKQELVRLNGLNASMGESILSATNGSSNTSTERSASLENSAVIRPVSIFYYSTRY